VRFPYDDTGGLRASPSPISFSRFRKRGYGYLLGPGLPLLYWCSVCQFGPPTRGFSGALLSPPSVFVHRGSFSPLTMNPYALFDRSGVSSFFLCKFTIFFFFSFVFLAVNCISCRSDLHYPPADQSPFRVFFSSPTAGTSQS